MMANVLHRRPPSTKGKAPRAVLFFSGRTNLCTEDDVYEGYQISKEKLYLKLTQHLIFSLIGESNFKKTLPSTLADNAHIVTYFFKCMANATQESIMSGQFDETMYVDEPTHFDFKDPCFKELFDAFCVECLCVKQNPVHSAYKKNSEKYRNEIELKEKQMSNQLENLEVSKNLFTTYFAQRVRNSENWKRGDKNWDDANSTKNKKKFRVRVR